MSAGNTAWVLTATALVLLMTPGLGFFYGGLVKQNSVVNTIKMSFVALGVIALQWALVGYSIAFAPGGAFLGSLQWIGLKGVGAEAGPYADDIPHLVFMLFQMMFAIITPALISGAVVGRMRFKAYVAFISAWGLLVYAPIAHWVWGSGGWIGEFGALDFAGGSVVHISAGVSALVAAWMLGPRRSSEESDRPHNVPFVVLGAGLLWFGWFGFNAGSALAADGLAAIAIVTTMLSAAAGVVSWLLVENIRGNKPTVVGASIAAVVGLVAITPAAGYVTPMSAIAIGAIAALVSYGAMLKLKNSSLDDTLDVFACHGLGGVVGALLTGVFATTAVNPGGADGLLYGNPGLVLTQWVSVLATGIYSALGTMVILGALRLLMRLRPSIEEELAGIDQIEHAESAYALDQVMPRLALVKQNPSEV